MTPPADPMPVVLFARVSSESQDFERQLIDTRRHAEATNCRVVATISEKLSGTRRSRAKRPDLDQLMALARSGKVKMVIVTELSRLGRRPRETRDVVEGLGDLGVSVFALNIMMGYLLPSGEVNPFARLLMILLMEVDGMETNGTSHRVRSGQARAYAAGAQKGRPVGTIQTVDKLLLKYPKVIKYLRAGLAVREAAAAAGVSTNTVLKVKNALGEVSS